MKAFFSCTADVTCFQASTYKNRVNLDQKTHERETETQQRERGRGDTTERNRKTETERHKGERVHVRVKLKNELRKGQGTSRELFNEKRVTDTCSFVKIPGTCG